MRRLVSWGLVGGFLAVMVYLIFFHVDERDKRLSGEAAAIVYDVSGAGKSTEFHYRYTVAGKTYEGTALTTNFALDVGRPAKACYDPKDPSQSMLKPMASECGSGMG